MFHTIGLLKNKDSIGGVSCKGKEKAQRVPVVLFAPLPV
jgi:hypothetical protein